MAIAIPVAWVVTNRWLEGFTYRTEVNWSVFLAASLTVLLMAGLTVSYESIRAAFANPVKSLQNE